VTNAVHGQFQYGRAVTHFPYLKCHVEGKVWNCVNDKEKKSVWT